MKQVTLDAKIRDKKGKKYCKKVRRTGIIPAILYGKGFESVSIEVPEKEFRKAIATHAGQNVILELLMAGNGENSQLAMIAEIQKDPLGLLITHIDFHKISLDTKVTAEIPVHLHGESAGVKRGGILDHVTWTIEVEALPMAIPDGIDLNVSSLDFEDSITIKDIIPPEGVTVLGDPDAVVVIVHPPRTEAEVTVAPEAELVTGAEKSAEPEVIKRGKEEKEGE